MPYDGLIEGLRAWIEGIRSWVLSQPGLSFLHDWMLGAPASAIWLIVLAVVTAVILAIGFWPPLRDQTSERGDPAEPDLADRT